MERCQMGKKVATELSQKNLHLDMRARAHDIYLFYMSGVNNVLRSSWLGDGLLSLGDIAKDLPSAQTDAYDIIRNRCSFLVLSTSRMHLIMWWALVGRMWLTHKRAGASYVHWMLKWRKPTLKPMQCLSSNCSLSWRELSSSNARSEHKNIDTHCHESQFSWLEWVYYQLL